MRVRAGRRGGFIKVGTDPIIGMHIENENSIIVQIEIGIDLSLCLKNNIQIGKINFYGSPITNPNSLFGSENYYDGLRSAIRFDSNEKADITNVRNAKVVSSAKFDITSIIPNDRIKEIEAGFKNNFRITSVSKTNSLLTDRFTFTVEQPTSSKYQSVEEFCNNSILLGKDPVTLYGNFPIVDPANQNNRTTRRSNPTQFENYKIVGIPGSYETGSVSSQYSSCVIKLRLSRDSLSNLPVLYGEILLIDNNGINVSLDKFNLNTSRIERDISYAYERYQAEKNIPYSKSTASQSSVREKAVGSAENDNYFIRTFGKKGDENQSPYYSIPLNVAIDERSKKTSSYSIIRRVNKKRITDSKVKSPNSIKSTSPRQQTNRVIPFSLRRIGDSIEILCETDRTDVISIGIEKRDATLRERFYRLRSRDAEDVLVARSASARFIDHELKNDHIYEYRLFFIDRFSNSYSTENSFLYHYASTKANQPASISISEIKRDIVDDRIPYPTFSFRIVATIASTGAEVIKEFVSKNGLSLGDLGVSENEYESYKKLFIYQIDRQNIRTGDVETFGTVLDDQFIDDSASPTSHKSVKPLNLLDKYKYYVRLGLRDPSALIPNQRAERTRVDGKRKFSFNSYKFAISPKSGIIPSVKTLEQNQVSTMRENFKDFSLGVEASCDLNPENYYPSVIGLSCRKTLIGFTLLEWSVTGEQESIDHFRIYATADGVEAHIGSAHPHVVGEPYFFEDTQLHNRIGEIVYRVVPVLLNFKESPGFLTTSMINENNLPGFMR